MKLHIFNPEHDLALAANIDNYTAPHAGRQLRRDLGFIPALWADEGDFVLVDDIDDAYDKFRHLSASSSYIYNKVEFITPLQLSEVFKNTMLVDSIHPWGWDKALVFQLKHIGCPEIMLPTSDSLEKMRTVSGRQWAAHHLQENVRVVEDVELLRAVISEGRKVVVKAPWSSSGRGVRYVSLADGTDLEATLKWASNIIRQQGAVTVEPYYNKVRDFGMEFEMKDGKIRYRGLSLFQTVKGAYTGNILATEEEKEDMLAAIYESQGFRESGLYAGKQMLAADKSMLGADKSMRNPDFRKILQEVREDIISRLQPVLHDVYSGPFGVDMMVYADEAGDLRLNPCVELNLRRTMGHVALDLGLPDKTSRHIMKVDFDGNRYRLRVLPGQPSDDAPWH